MEIGWLTRHRYRWLLPAINLAGCALFVALRPPAPAEYLTELDEARRAGGFVLSSTVSGMVACRPLYPWNEWHGGEASSVKLVEIANAPALAMTVGIWLVGEISFARGSPACAWSWVLAAVFAVAASAQWWLIGMAVDAARHRLRRGRRLGGLRSAP
jgi:hypothetical protein